MSVKMKRGSRHSRVRATTVKRRPAHPGARHDPGSWPRSLLHLYAAEDLDTLIDVAFRVLHRAVASDFESVVYRRAGDLLLKQRDSRGRVYDPEFMRRHADLTPARLLVLASRGIKVLPSRAGLPQSDEDLHKMEFYRAVMKPQGWRHAVALCFWDDPPAEFPVFVLNVHRRLGRADFSDEDLATLEHIHEFMDPAIRRLHERSEASAVHDGMATTLRQVSQVGLIVLDWRLRTVRANTTARRLCSAWMRDVNPVGRGTARGTMLVPPGILDTCRELGRELQSVLRDNPDANVMRRRHASHATVPTLSASVTMICRSTTGLAEPSFVVEIDDSSHSATPIDRAPALLHKMTAAERDVALILVEGWSNQEIADRLGKTVHAVKFLLHRIYRKVNVPSRARLIAALRGQPTPHAR
jgi:DNA-binding CsgD family transcriptional regulator